MKEKNALFRFLRITAISQCKSGSQTSCLRLLKLTGTDFQLGISLARSVSTGCWVRKEVVELCWTRYTENQEPLAISPGPHLIHCDCIIPQCCTVTVLWQEGRSGNNIVEETVSPPSFFFFFASQDMQKALEIPALSRSKLCGNTGV